MPLISKTHWEAIQQLLDQVLDLPENERGSFLDRACKRQPELKQDILDLLDAEKKSPTFLERPAQELCGALISEPHQSHENVIIGAFKLIEEIGSGGMGAVYLAKRCLGDFEQTVAIKVLNNSGQNKDQLERFKREQQLLASLDHPNIAKLYDGGISESGQAYLIMEYVEGQTIDTYCKENSLDINARVHLIQQVAEAVGFAHKHLIIHRDLKPSNILVKADGTVKLLDFSIAKLVNQEDQLSLTQVGYSPLTPGYAAPEQLCNKAVSMPTDIYQLGLVSYLLLTGVPAFRNVNTSLASLIKKVCEERPDLPSKHTRTLRGDLDAIILKMLEREPEQRYATMDALIQDLQAYFKRLPISARQASWTYLLKRTLQRHWKIAVVGSVFLILLSGYALTTTWQARKIENALLKSQTEQAKSEQVSGFLLKVFNAADPNISGFESITAQQLLENGEKRILEALQNVPEVRIHMLNILAQIWQRQGDYAHAQEILDIARKSTSSALEKNTAEFAKTLSITGHNYLLTGKNDLALQYTKQAVSLYESLVFDKIEVENDEYAYVLLLKAQVLSAFGNNEEARPIVEKVVHLLLRNSTINIEYLSLAYAELAIIQHISGEFKAARTHMEKAAELQKRVSGENHTYYTTFITNLAIFYQDAEQFDRAEQLAREALRIHENIFGPKHPFSIHAKRTAAVILHRKGKLEEAETLLRKIVAFESTLEQSDSYENLSTTLQLGAIFQDRGKMIEAEALYKHVIDVLSKQPGSELLGRAVAKLATLKYQQLKFRESLALFKQALSMFEEQSVLSTVAEVGLAKALLKLNQYSEALKLSKLALNKRKRIFSKNHSWVIESELVYGIALLQLGRSTEALTIIKTNLAKARKSPSFQFGERLLLYKVATNITN